jgi:hypothetical protein
MEPAAADPKSGTSREESSGAARTITSRVPARTAAAA